MTSDDIARHWPGLMQAAQQGNAAAYRRLLTEITPPLKRFLKIRLISQDQADDVCQEILLAIHAARHTYRPEQPFANWMYGIARHKLIDHLRRHIRKTSNEINDEDLVTFLADGANNPEEALNASELRQALDILPTQQRRVLVLTKIEGFSMAEAAVRVGMTESAVKVTAHRAYKKMKEWLIVHGYE